MNSEKFFSVIAFSFCATFLGFIMLSHCVFAQTLKLKVWNKTGYDLDSLYVGKKYFGSLKKDASKVISGLPYLTLQGEVPITLLKANISEKKQAPVLSKCGTKSVKISRGNYLFDIHMMELSGRYRLYWQAHK